MWVSLMFRSWSTECSVPVIARSFFSSTVTCQPSSAPTPTSRELQAPPLLPWVCPAQTKPLGLVGRRDG